MNRIERLAVRTARKYCHDRYGFFNRDSERCDDAVARAAYHVVQLLKENSDYSNNGLVKLAKLRLSDEMAYRDSCVQKSKHYVESERDASQQAGESERNHFIQTIRIRDARDYFEGDASDVDEYSTCEDQTDRTIVLYLTTTNHTSDTIAKTLGMTDYQYKQRVRNIKSREASTRRGDRTSDPSTLRKLRVLAHDNGSFNSGCPVHRLKEMCCETELDKLLVDLYRQRLTFAEIADQVNQSAAWIEHRLGVIAHRCLTM